MQRSGAAGPRKSFGAHLRLDVLADPPETTDIAREKRKGDGVQQIGHVALLADRTDVHLEADVSLEHGRAGATALVLDPERHWRDYTVRQLSHLEERKGRGISLRLD